MVIILLLLLTKPAFGIIGDFKCTQSWINSAASPQPPISTEVVDVSKGVGTYYVLNRVYLNTSLLLTGYYPVSGSTYRNLLLKGTQWLSTNWFLPPFLSEFNSGIFVKARNSKPVLNGITHSEFGTIVFGTSFVNTTYTIVIEPSTQIINGKLVGTLSASVCQYTMCEYPNTACNPALGNGRPSLWHASIGIVPCLYQRNFTYNVAADNIYFHFYQDGGTFYAYVGDKSPITTLLFQVYLGTVVTHYYVLPLVCNARETYEYWVTPLTKREYLLVFDGNGAITNAVDCASDHMSEIQCMTQNIKPVTGVYELTGYTVQPIADVYRRIPNLPDCEIEQWLNDPQVPSPISWERKIFSNCNFNMSSLLSKVRATSFSCNNIDASKIYDMCFGSITIDKFAIPNSRKVDLQFGSSGYIQNYNYRLDQSATSCQLYYGIPANNVTVTKKNPSGWNNRYGFVEFKPLNSGQNYNKYSAIYSTMCFNVPNDYCPCKLGCPTGTVVRPQIGTSTSGQPIYDCPGYPWLTGSSCKQTPATVGVGQHCPGVGVMADQCAPSMPGNSMITCSCSNTQYSAGTSQPYYYAWTSFGADTCLSGGNCQVFANVLLNNVNSGTTCATDLQKANTEIIVGVCVKYDLYGISGQGIFTEVNATYYNSWQNLLYDSNGGLYGFKDFLTNRTYMIRSCYSGRVSAAYHSDTDEPALLYRNLKCSYVFNNSISMSRSVIRYFDSYLGCVVNADDDITQAVGSCNLTVGSGYCVDYSATRRAKRDLNTGYRLTNFEPFVPTLVNDSVESVGGLYEIQIPTEFTIGNLEEFVQTTSPKVTIDCAAFVCGDYAACREQLVEYGSFCDNINTILNEVNSMIDTSQYQLASTLMSGVTLSSRLKDGISFNQDDINFSSVMGCVGSNCISHRSAIEDILFNKVKLSDVGFVDAYNNCTQGSEIRDLVCVQSFNGIKVLPPVLSESQMSGYATGVGLSMLFPPFSAAAGVPFTMSVQYRINGLGVTMDVLNQNQKMIANAFNNALTAIQNGFDATNSALAKIQSVVNANAEALNNLLQQLSNRFGAISSSLQEILSRLDALEAQVQIDRLINGRLTALNAYVSQQLSDITLVKFSASQAIEKINECVKSQSTRVNFCGKGNHILSLVQNAPYGLYFIHFSYQPTKYTTVYVSPGLCLAGDVGVAPKSGYFIKVNDKWMFTGSGYYHPEPITNDNVIMMSNCAVNFTKAPDVVLNTSIPNLPDFKEELDKWFKNQSSVAPDLSLDLERINVTFLDLQEEMDRIQDAIKKLNDSYINLKEIGTYEMYVKWPWYVWLLIGLAGVAVLVLLFFVCCCTGCGVSCFKKCGSCCDDYGGHQDIVVKTSHDD